MVYILPAILVLEEDMTKEQFIASLALAQKNWKDSGETITLAQACQSAGLPTLDPNYCPIAKALHTAVKFPKEVTRLSAEINQAWEAYTQHLSSTST